MILKRNISFVPCIYLTHLGSDGQSSSHATLIRPFQLALTLGSVALNEGSKSAYFIYLC